MDFKVIGPCTDIETIAVGSAIRDLKRLERDHGKGRWRKMKGRCRVEYEDGAIAVREVHWYEAHGIGQRDHKIKEPS